MSNILNLLTVNQRTVGIVSAGALATFAAYCVYSRSTRFINSKEQRERLDEENRVSAVSASTTESSNDSGLPLSDGFESLANSGWNSSARGPRDSAGSVNVDDDHVAMPTSGFEAARELELVAKAMLPDSIAKAGKPIVEETHSMAESKPNRQLVAKNASSVAKDDSEAPALTPQFIDARLSVLGNAPENAALLLVEGDAEVLATRLALPSNDTDELVRLLQLVGRLLLSPQRAETLCRSGRLPEAIAEVYAGGHNVEVRVRCILALTSARAAATCGVMEATDERLATLLAEDAVASERLRPHALRLLAQLAPGCRSQLAARVPAFLTLLKRLGSAEGGGGGGSGDDVAFCLLAGLLARLLGNDQAGAGARGLALAQTLTSAREFAAPASRRLRRDVAMRAAWLDFLAAVAGVECRADLASLWWPVGGGAGVGGGRSGGGGGGGGDLRICLAGAIRQQIPELYKQLKKLAGDMKSAEKRSIPGQRLLAVKKEAKALKQLAKHRPKASK